MAEEEEPLSRLERVYTPLGDYLRSVSAVEDAALSFADIELIIGRPLPAQARANAMWWGSIPRQPQSRAWLRADRRAIADLVAETVTFVFQVFERNNSLEKIQSIRSYWLGYARTCLASEEIRGGADSHVELGWWEPHDTYLLHLPSLGMFKVGIAHVGSRRVSDLAGSRGRLVDRLTLHNHWAALVVEHHVLELAWDAWKRPDRFATGDHGETERWADWLVPPPLSAVCDSLVDDRQAPGWNLSVYREGA